MDVAGDIIAVYAAVVSTGAALIAWYAWRRAPESTVELRQIKATSSADGVAISVIAVNRSSHELVLSKAQGTFFPTHFRAETPLELSPFFYHSPLVPEGTGFPLKVPSGQGALLRGELRIRHWRSGSIEVEVVTNTGRKFRDGIDLEVDEAPAELPDDLFDVS